MDDAWNNVNRFLSRRLHPLHSCLKRAAAGWMRASSPFPPALKRVSGRLTWVHPRLLTADTGTERHVEAWIAGQLRRGDVFFDVGAHYGWMSLHAARCLKRAGRIVAFEPAPLLVEMLRYHKRVNRLHQLTVVPKAVSDRDAAAVPFYLLNSGGLSSRSSLTIGERDLPYFKPEELRRITVPSTTLDSFCSQSGTVPSLIKIDVEGAELMVLRGAAKLLQAHRPALIVAAHPYWLPESESPEGIFTFLAAYGYSVRESHVTHIDGYDVGDYLCTNASAAVGPQPKHIESWMPTRTA